MSYSSPLLLVASAPGLDVDFLSACGALIVAVGSILIYASNKYAKFNKENQSDNQATVDSLNRKIYQVGTAPLVNAINSYIYEQLVGNFTAPQQRVIEKYEIQKQAMLDPQGNEFIDMSNLPESFEFDTRIKDLVSAHSASAQYNKDYQSMRDNLRTFRLFAWLPVFFLAVSILLLFAIYIFKLDDLWIGLRNASLMFGLLSIIPEGVFYFRYLHFCKMTDNYMSGDGRE